MSEFRDIGADLMGCKSSLKCFKRRYRSVFGTDPSICGLIWERLEKRGWIAYAGKRQKKVHLMWSLMFLKGYGTVEVYATQMRVSERTFKKWCWFYLEGMASLDKEVVRLIFFVFY